MNDKFLERLERLEQALSELKSEYISANAPPAKLEPEKPAAPKTVQPEKSEFTEAKTIFIKAPPLHETEAEKLKTVIKLEPENSTAPKNAPPPLPPAPESDFGGRTLHIKAPPPHEIEAEKLKTVIKPGAPVSGAPSYLTGDSARQEEKSPAFKVPVEWFVGRRLFGSLGMLLVLIGICFGVVYAYRTFNFSPELRIGAACVFSILISISGFFLRHPKYRFLSLLLKGGGMGGLYIAIFAGFQYYNLFGVTLTGGALAAIAALVLALSWYEKSQVIGVFATIGAFLMPVLVKTPNPNHLFFCFYLLTINLPVILLGLQRKWQLLYNLSFVLSLVMAVPWMYQYGHGHWQIILTFWVLFTLEYIGLALIKLRHEFDFTRIVGDYLRIILLMSANVMVIRFFGEDYIDKGNWLIYATVLYAAAAVGAYWLTRKYFGEFMLFLTGAALFLALAIPEIFTEYYEVYLAWSVEALALGILAFFTRSRGINRLATVMILPAWVAIHADYLMNETVFKSSLFFNKVNVLGKIGLLMLLIQGGLGMWRFEKSTGSKIVVLAASFGLLGITTVNAGYYFDWHEPWLLFTAFPLAVASLIYCWAAHLFPRYGFLSLASVLWFVFIILSALTPGNGPSHAWQLSLWAPGALALYWLLPRGNPFRLFASIVCVAAVVKCFHLQGQGWERAFFNLPFLFALLSGAIFLALNWTPPWIRHENDRLLEKFHPHLVSLGIIGIGVIFCLNFHHLNEIYLVRNYYLAQELTILAVVILLASILYVVRNRVYAIYTSVAMVVLFVWGGCDFVSYGFDAAAFGAYKFYIWLGMLAVCWVIIGICGKVLDGRENIFLRLVSGSLFIFLIYHEFGRLPDPNFAQAFSLVFLTVAAILICGWGLWKRRPAARYYSFVLLGIAVIQLIGRSLWSMKDPARIFAFILLGLLLLGLSFIYHKVSELIDAKDRGGLEQDKET